MKSDTLLHSLVFQLTPTRTRCDLVVIANGRTEKLASGLVNPFLAHLKAAQDQIAKGGYSITLIPDCEKDATWFTKGTVERFVRFVSTPEVLERVSTIEAEILQIGEAISIQNNGNLGITQVESHPKEYSNRIGGAKSVIDADTESAIVLYKPEAHPFEPNVSANQGEKENSKIQLLRVLETRKTALQKEQGMAFARAAAAGFDLDHLMHLILFAECFGASRLMDACVRFSELWKQKHETGQWVEIKVGEVMTASDFSSATVSGVMISGDQQRQSESEPESKCKLGADDGFASSNVRHDGGRSGFEVPNMHNQGVFFKGNYQAHRYAQRTMPPSPAGLMFQHYPMLGMPCYTNYPGVDSLYMAQHARLEDHGHDTTRKMRRKVNTSCTKDSYSETEDAPLENFSGSDSDSVINHGSKFVRSRRKEFRHGASKSQSSAKSERHHTLGSEVGSPEREQEDVLHRNEVKKEKTKSSELSKGETKLSHLVDIGNSNHGDDNPCGPETDNGNWKAFQDCLLRDDQERKSPVGKDIYSSEKEIYYKRKQHEAIADPILDGNRDLREVPELSMHTAESANGSIVPFYQKKLSMDEPTNCNREFHVSDSVVDFQLMENNGKGHMKVPADVFVISSGEVEGNGHFFTDSITHINIDHKNPIDLHILGDESFVVPHRLNLSGHESMDRGNIDVQESDLRVSLEERKEFLNKRIARQVHYEPDELSVMLKRGMDSTCSVHEPVFDSKMEVHFSNVASRKSEVGGESSTTRVPKKVVKEKKHSAEMRNADGIVRKVKPSRLSSTTDVQLRAERLQAYKADLQKIKKEKEEEEIKRLEALKRERQKRISARTSSTTTSPSLQSKSRLPTMFYPGSVKTSKFCDSEPTSASPLSKLPLRTHSLESSETLKKTIGRKINDPRTTGSGLSRSVSSLPDLKKEVNFDFNDSEKSSAQTRRLSDPKDSTRRLVHPNKLPRHDLKEKAKVTNDTEAKKMSAIMNLDRTKSASLPGLKIKARHRSSSVDSFETKEAMQTASNEISDAFGSTKLKTSDENCYHLSNQYDNYTVVEKAIVLLGKETTPVQDMVSSSEELDLLKGVVTRDYPMENSVDTSDYVAIHAPASPVVADQATQGYSEIKHAMLPNFHEGKANLDKNEVSYGHSDASLLNEMPYQAPFARLSSLEKPCSSYSELGKAPGIISSESTLPETSKANISGMTDRTFQHNSISGFLEKPKNKDSSKGFRRLLNFGRKTHRSTCSEHNDVTEKSDVNYSGGDACDTVMFSLEVPTLKNLISQDESPVASKSHKDLSDSVSRALSLLSPFRCKTGGKKLVT